MEITVTGQQISVTDALKNRVVTSLEKIKSQQVANIHRVHVVLATEKNDSRCDLQAFADNENFVAKAKDADMYIAIDRAVDKLQKQLSTAKSRQLSGRKQ